MRKLVMAAAGAVLFGLSTAGHATVAVTYLSVETDALTILGTGFDQYYGYQTFVDKDMAAPQVIGRTAAANATYSFEAFESYVGSNFVFLDNEHIMLDVAGAWNWNALLHDAAYTDLFVFLNYSFSISETYAYNISYDAAWDSPWTVSKSHVYFGSLFDTFVEQFTGLSGSGSFSGMIGPGDYTLWFLFDNSTSIDRHSVFGLPSGSGNSHFTFSLLSVAPPGPPVPEPVTWVMMTGGFALAGGAMRRRNVAIQFV